MNYVLLTFGLLRIYWNVFFYNLIMKNDCVSLLKLMGLLRIYLDVFGDLIVER